MKKIFIIFMFNLLTLVLISCSNQNSSSNSNIKQNSEFINDINNNTMEKDEAFMRKVENIAKDFGYEVIIEDAPVTSSSRDLIININENEYIDVYFKNLGYKTGTGDSLFSVEYYNYNKSDSYNFNADMFIKIINIISAKELSNKELSIFLNGDEQKYPPEKFDYKKLGDESIKKVTGKNDKWEMIYTEFKDGSVSLYFGGLTK
ncbi:MAG: hypothetical protein K2F81_06295 [Ruminococcus sp.]|nr:hypothetical protein [Ruminococcus sp.]